MITREQKFTNAVKRASHLSKMADRIAYNLRQRRLGTMTWDALRDYCDIDTGGGMDTIELDILTDMVKGRL